MNDPTNTQRASASRRRGTYSLLMLSAAVVFAGLVCLLVAIQPSQADPNSFDKRTPQREQRSEGTTKPVQEAQPGERRVEKGPDGELIVAGELIVTYKEGASTQGREDAKRSVGARTKMKLTQINAESLSFPEIKNEQALQARREGLERKKAALERNPNVAVVEYNYVGELMAPTNDPSRGVQDPTVVLPR